MVDSVDASGVREYCSTARPSMMCALFRVVGLITREGLGAEYIKEGCYQALPGQG